MATQSRGAPYPLGTDANNTAADIQALSLWVNDRPGVSPLTTTQINALTGVDRWDGRVVLDTTLDRLKRWDAGLASWVLVADFSEIAALLATSGTPAALADTASRGVSGSAARADHVHAWPAWQAYTPTVGNMTLGTGGTSSGRYVQLGKTVHFRAKVVLGTGFTLGVGGPPGVTFPVASSVLTAVGRTAHLSGVFNDAGTASYTAVVTDNGAGYAVMYGLGVSGGLYNITASNPFAFAAGDSLEYSGTIEAA